MCAWSPVTRSLRMPAVERAAALMAAEGAVIGAAGGDARRLLIARLVLDRRLAPQDPLKLDESPFEAEAAELLLSDTQVSIDQATALLQR